MSDRQNPEGKAREVVFFAQSPAEWALVSSVLESSLIQQEIKPSLFLTGDVARTDALGNEAAVALADKLCRLGRASNGRKDTPKHTKIQNTVRIFSRFIDNQRPDLVVIVAGSVESLAVSTVCALENTPCLLLHYTAPNLDPINLAGLKMAHSHIVFSAAHQSYLLGVGEVNERIKIGPGGQDEADTAALVDFLHKNFQMGWPFSVALQKQFQTSQEKART